MSNGVAGGALAIILLAGVTLAISVVFNLTLLIISYM